MRSVRFGSAIVLSVLVVLAGASSASGHDPAVYYPIRWGALGGTLAPDWRFMTGFPAGSARSRFRDGITQWSNQGQPFTFGAEQGDAAWWNMYGPCNNWTGRNGISLTTVGGDGPGGQLGETRVCFHTTGAPRLRDQEVRDLLRPWRELVFRDRHWTQ
jgi:hypothetical protein